MLDQGKLTCRMIQSKSPLSILYNAVTFNSCHKVDFTKKKEKKTKT